MVYPFHPLQGATGAILSYLANTGIAIPPKGVLILRGRLTKVKTLDERDFSIKRS